MTLDNVENTPATEVNTPAPAENTPVQQEAPTVNADDEKETPKSLFPDNWQELMASDDKEKNLLSRYGSPKDVAKALREAQIKLSERAKIQIPTDKSTDDEKKAFRDLFNIPEKPTDYQIKLDGREISEADKPVIDSFLEKMHAKNATPEVVQSAIDTYYEMQEQQLQLIEQVNKEQQLKLEDDLRLEYGRNYRANIATAKTFIEKTFGNNSEAILKAIGHDGVMLMNNPDIMRAFVNLGLADNPRATIPSGYSSVDNVASRMKEIEKHIATGAYYKDQAMQDEYAKLIEFSQKNK